jgi:ribosomal protein S6--L-glutamate ligase
VDSPADLATLEIAEADHSFLLAQSYIDNTGFDIKLYVVGTEVYAVAKRSPLHPDVVVDKRLIPMTLELRELALRVGKIFGLDIYGLDVVETSHGPVVVDINDFPSFGQVPQAEALLSAYVLQIASHAEQQRADHTKYMQQLSATRAMRLLNGDPLRATEDIVGEETHPFR